MSGFGIHDWQSTGVPVELEAMAYDVIGAAIEVHRELAGRCDSFDDPVSRDAQRSAVAARRAPLRVAANRAVKSRATDR